MNREQIIRTMHDQRAGWYELDDPPRRALRLRRLVESKAVAWYQRFEAAEKGPDAIGVMRDFVLAVIDDWRGFTEADLMGTEIGGDSAVPFDHEMFALWVEDETKLIGELWRKAFADYTAYRTKKADAEKNSVTSSTALRAA